MPWFGRLFGGSTPAPVEPPANTVLIADDIAAKLAGAHAAGDAPSLETAVNEMLRAHLDALAQPQPNGEGIPFWLQRGQAPTSDMEDELRDRVTQRRATEDPQ